MVSRVAEVSKNALIWVVRNFKPSFVKVVKLEICLAFDFEDSAFDFEDRP